MDKVFSITDRLRDKKRKEHEETHRQKAATVQRLVQCSSCQLSCAMCGSHLDAPDSSCPPASSYSNLNLCECCRAEYNDFLGMSNENKSSEIFWHNKEWMKLWSAWIEYHKAIKKFRNSNEFRRLIKESDLWRR
ncbi:MAG: hypothetical protein JRJ20_09810 [Deltaproteobacteria bacterium]|nr:hypothetical protein [Deltaproteobacteria bacterium]